jgi:uncharacterized membrane protein YkvA (DUF1232 family)
MWEVMKFALVGGTVLALAFVILLSLPQSKLREIALPVIAWTFTAVCGVYIFSPLDIIPDVIPVAGWIDDGGALIAGIASAATALTAGKGK